MADTRKPGKDIIGTMFLDTGLVMIFSQVVSIIAVVIDGVITSRILGDAAFSAVSLVNPLISIILLLAAFLAAGNQVVCSRLVGKGKREEASATLSAAMLAGLFLGALLLLLCVLAPDMILKLCGVSVENHPEFYDSMMQYLHGYIPTIPALILVQIIGPVIVMDNNKSLFTVSASVLCAADISGDLLNAFVFKGGVFGMGLATSVSTWIQLMMLLTHFMRHNSFFRILPGRISLSTIPRIAREGVPSFVQRLATTFRDLFISRFNLALALTGAAVASKGIQNDINTLLFCIGMGLGRTMLGMAGVHYGAEDAAGMKRLFRSAMKSSLAVSAAAGAAVFLGAPLIVRIYSSDPEVIRLSVFGVRCMAVGIVFDTIASVYLFYLQGIRKRKLLNLLTFFERFFLPILMAFLLGIRYGSRGVLASLAFGKIVLVLVIFLVIWICRRKVPRGLEDYMLLPEDFGGVQENNLYAHIDTLEEAMEESVRVEDFCKRHGAASLAKPMALVLEELAVNIITHGKGKKRGGFGVDYRLYADEDAFTLTVRDFCEYFDPTKWCELHSAEDIEAGIGIKIITGLSDDVQYYNAFNSNNIIVTIHRKGEQL